MAESVGIIRGAQMTLHSGGIQMTHITSASITMNGETIDVTSADSSGWKDFLFEDKSWTMEAEAFLAFDGAENIDTLMADWLAGDAVSILLTTDNIGDSEFGGSAFITNVSVNSSKGSAVTVSVSYQGSGALTYVVKT